MGYINPNDAGDPVTSPAPGNGVIVRFRMRTSAAEAVTLRLATVTKEGDTLLAQAVRSGSTVTTAGTGEIEEFQARLVVHQGEHIALDAPAAHMVYNQGGDEFTPLSRRRSWRDRARAVLAPTPPASCSSRPHGARRRR